MKNILGVLMGVAVFLAAGTALAGLVPELAYVENPDAEVLFK